MAKDLPEANGPLMHWPNRRRRGARRRRLLHTLTGRRRCKDRHSPLPYERVPRYCADVATKSIGRRCSR